LQFDLGAVVEMLVYAFDECHVSGVRKWNAPDFTLRVPLIIQSSKQDKA
jgi:hypothetical protein